MNSTSTILTAVAEANHLPVFFFQVALLIVVGRLLGEILLRLGQPAVVGQLLAGIVLGPSVFGALWPGIQHEIFPGSGSDLPMLKAISEMGVLMLLLLTGMETDLSLVKRVWRSAALTSVAGVVVPFTGGFLLGEVLPEALLPDPERRVITSLFLATALSISSVKIVAVVLGASGFLRRNLGQLILASAIVDDTIGWTLLALIGGLATHSTVQAGPLAFSIVATGVFIAFCFTIGRRLVAGLIRWANDRLRMEMPVISLALVLMLLLGLFTNLIGVHTVLGAFMAGIMIGQSPLLTKHIAEQLRGVIVALFMPVFFGVAGLSIDLKVLADPRLLGLTGLLIGVATFGKLGGCYLGGRLSGLRNREAFAVGCGMNARGSTEIILATIGLTMGALSQQLFTLIVLMAVLTTLVMPSTLRWALSRVPVKKEEKARLEKELAREDELLSRIQRVLVMVNGSPTGRAMARLAGAFLGARRLSASAVDEEGKGPSDGGPSALDELFEAAEHSLVHECGKAGDGVGDARSPDLSAREFLTVLKSAPEGDQVADLPQFVMAEAEKGYDLVLLGQASPDSLEEIAKWALSDFPGAAGILITDTHEVAFPLRRILVPLTGTDFSRFGAEVAISVAKGMGASVTALHVVAPSTDRRGVQSKLTDGMHNGVPKSIETLGNRSGVSVIPKLAIGHVKEDVISREGIEGGHQLIVLGIKSHRDEASILGPSATAILKRAPCPVLIVKS